MPSASISQIAGPPAKLPAEGDHQHHQYRQQQDLDDVHVGHDVALGQQSQPNITSLGKNDAVLVVERPKLPQCQRSGEIIGRASALGPNRRNQKTLTPKVRTKSKPSSTANSITA